MQTAKQFSSIMTSFKETEPGEALYIAKLTQFIEESVKPYNTSISGGLVLDKGVVFGLNDLKQLDWLKQLVPFQENKNTRAEHHFGMVALWHSASLKRWKKFIYYPHQKDPQLPNTIKNISTVLSSLTSYQSEIFNIPGVCLPSGQIFFTSFDSQGQAVSTNPYIANLVAKHHNLPLSFSGNVFTLGRVEGVIKKNPFSTGWQYEPLENKDPTQVLIDKLSRLSPIFLLDRENHSWQAKYQNTLGQLDSSKTNKLLIYPHNLPHQSNNSIFYRMSDFNLPYDPDKDTQHIVDYISKLAPKKPFTVATVADAEKIHNPLFWSQLTALQESQNLIIFIHMRNNNSSDYLSFDTNCLPLIDNSRISQNPKEFCWGRIID